MLQFSSNKFLTRYFRSRFSGLAGQVRHCFYDKYSLEDKEKILSIVNTATQAEDFKQFDMSKKSITSLLKLKREKGDVQSLEDFKTILSTRMLDKMFCSMINKDNWTPGSAMHPVLNDKQISKSKRVLSFILSGGCVSLCCIHRSDDILSVQLLRIVEYHYKPKMHLLNTLKEMKNVALHTPNCDLCLMEDYPPNLSGQHSFLYQLQMGQAKSMFLGFKSALPNPPLIVAVKRYSVARVFNTFIGSEKVSGQPIVENLFTNSPNLVLKDGMLDSFMEAEPPTKELLSNVFLLNLAYWKLTNQFIINNSDNTTRMNLKNVNQSHRN